MAGSFLASNRTILLVSDDALYIYSSGGKKGLSLVEVVPWTASDFAKNVATIISKDCGGKPVTILNDMVEQHFRKEKVARVSVMDRQNVLTRKLRVAFPNYPIRSALLLKEKLSKEEKKNVSGVYIFAAVPVTEPFKKTMEAAEISLAPISGFCLLPVEASAMVKKLSEKLTPKGKKKAKWTIFMGQHKHGGLRQIVTKDGELALTRMTPVPDFENESAWINGVQQEFKATMSYLSRFGFDLNDGLNVVLVSEPNMGERVQELIDVSCEFFAMSPEQVSKLLKLNIGTLSDTYYADSLHVAWVAGRNSFVLPMKSKAVDKVSKPRQLTIAASVLLGLGLLAQGYQFLDVFASISSNWEDIDLSTNKKLQLDVQYQKEVNKKEALGFDIQLIQSSLSIVDNIKAKQINIFPILYNIGIALGRDMRIDSLNIDRGGDTLVKSVSDLFDPNAPAPVLPLYVATLQLTFPSTTDAEKGNAEVKKLQEALQTLLSDSVVKVSKFLEDYEYSEEIVVEFDADKEKKATQDFVSEIVIEGPSQ